MSLTGIDHEYPRGMSGPEPSPQLSPPATKVDWTRRILAGLIFLSLTAIVVASYLPGGPRICRDQLSSNGSVVPVCRPIGTDDVIPVGLILAVVLLFLGPDLSEFGVGGLFNVKLRQRIAAAEKKADEAAAEAAYVALGSPVPSVASIQKAATSAQAKQPTISGRSPAIRVLSEERQELEKRLGWLTRELDVYVQVLSERRSPGDAPYMLRRAFGLTGAAARTVSLEIRAWASTYQEELAEWAKVRNLFVHYPERLSDAEVSAAIGLADRLLVGARKIWRVPETYLHDL